MSYGYREPHRGEKTHLLFDEPDLHSMEGVAIHGNTGFKTSLLSHITTFYGGGELWQGGAFDAFSIEDARRNALRRGEQYKQAHGLDLRYFDVIVDVYGGGYAPLIREDAELIKVPLNDARLTADAIEKFKSLGVQVAYYLALGKKVLVHCQAGLNRSGLTSALALNELGITPRDAIKTLRATRCNAVLCNQDFVKLLESIEDGKPYEPFISTKVGFQAPLTAQTATGWSRTEEDVREDDLALSDQLAWDAADNLWEEYSRGELTWVAFKAAMDRLVASNASLT